MVEEELIARPDASLLKRGYFCDELKNNEGGFIGKLYMYSTMRIGKKD